MDSCSCVSSRRSCVNTLGIFIVFGFSVIIGAFFLVLIHILVAAGVLIVPAANDIILVGGFVPTTFVVGSSYGGSRAATTTGSFGHGRSPSVAFNEIFDSQTHSVIGFCPILSSNPTRPDQKTVLFFHDGNTI
jgi:hypothetical protein